jgi:hypothetical protein
MANIATVKAATAPKAKRTKGEEAAGEVKALIRARNPLIWIVTREESRVERFLYEAVAAAGYLPYTWDVAEGVTYRMDQPPVTAQASLQAALDKIKEASLVAEPLPGVLPDPRKRAVWILRDLPVWISGAGGAMNLRKMRNLAKRLSRTPSEVAQVMIVLSPHGEIPPELADHATVIKWPLPDREEITRIFDTCTQGKELGLTPTQRTGAIDAAVGLSSEEVMACFARSMTRKRIDPKIIAAEKKRIVARDGYIEWYDPIPEGLNAVGGLGELKEWLGQRASAFSEAARAYGLLPPKGVMLVGYSGCGKSLTAKAIATAWNMPLLRIDLGSLKGGTVGSSERALRNVFETIAAIGRCVVWFDEIEKALAGGLSGARDAGVSADQLGAILQWMQERKGEAFVVATANDIEVILQNAPELLRKGRFDEIFFVDLPNLSERPEIVKAALRASIPAARLPGLKIDLKKVAAATDKFTGAEVASLVPDAMISAFADDAREITTNDLLKVAKKIVPLSKTAGEKFATLRKWLDGGNARRASFPEDKPAPVARVQHETRQLDIIEDEDETEETE